MTDKPKHRANDWWDQFMEREKEANESRKARYKDAELDHCAGYEDGMDGFVIHTSSCERYQQTAMSGTGCINYRGNTTWTDAVRKARKYP